MKKNFSSNKYFYQNIKSNPSVDLEKMKTSNVNILLNRVQQNKKKDFQKKLNFLSLLVLVLTLVGLFSIL
tara:strand:+ start:395 stop:604 length:210 start_codon:yes stop_codon:yes gene_type:complete